MPRVKPTEMILPLVSRDQFPLLEHYPKLVYLDSAATTQKPQSVIDAEVRFYETSNANVHRGIYTLAERATNEFEAARATVAKFVGGESNEIIFTKGTTESINLVAQSFVRPRLTKNHQIIVSIAEHHSNFVPWQQLAKETGAKLTVVPLRGSAPLLVKEGRGEILDSPATTNPPNPLFQRGNDRQSWELDLEFFEQSLKDRPTAIVAVADVSNVLGTVNPTAKIIQLAHKYHAPVLVDAAQSLAHLPVNVDRLDADFLVGSGHKLYGPTGIGFLWAKQEHLEAMAPYQFGGDMIRSVTVEQTTWNDIPWKFEAGTPNIAGAIGFAAALDWLCTIGYPPLSKRGVGGDFMSDHSKKIPLNPPFAKGEVQPNWEAIANHEEQLLEYADKKLRAIPGLTILGPSNPRDRAGVIAFSIRGIHPHDLATLLDERGIAVRAGHHCSQPLHESLGLQASARISFGVYNGSADVDKLVVGIRAAVKLLKE